MISSFCFVDTLLIPATSQLILPESLCPDPSGLIRCTSFSFEFIYCVKLNYLAGLVPLNSWPGQSNSYTLRRLKTWCSAQMRRPWRHHDGRAQNPLLLPSSWQVWGAQFITTLDKVPAGCNRANSSFQVIISVRKVSIETPLSGRQIPWGNMARSEPAAQKSDAGYQMI